MQPSLCDLGLSRKVLYVAFDVDCCGGDPSDAKSQKRKADRLCQSISLLTQVVGPGSEHQRPCH